MEINVTYFFKKQTVRIALNCLCFCLKKNNQPNNVIEVKENSDIYRYKPTEDKELKTRVGMIRNEALNQKIEINNGYID